ncbi:MAG: FMN-binding protein [Firmicutes bacterium]|nr:FMN-binding protein [Bacillota bacterium]
MKKWQKILIIILVIVGSITVFAVIKIKEITSNLEALLQEEVLVIDLSLIEDGTYFGAYSSFPIIVEVEVTILSHEVTQIIITKHDNGQGEPAEAIVDEVILSQSLQVDAIAGASYSSKVILLAIEDALVTLTLVS